jgi:excisionase family DNA binding protein
MREMKNLEGNALGWPRLMSVKIAAQYLSLSPRTIYNAISKNAETPFPVRPKRYGKRVLFEKKDLDKWVDSLSH